ncbi:MAG TPA: pilus assembly PilX N-terminal domain-containing protein [Candidatus Woesebacteria bacterium]|jgi:hypothetical protein|nr:pilus assembly PilX N-terminal domain-containing protein [Candidatus Woesebacteria bacterium]
MKKNRQAQVAIIALLVSAVVMVVGLTFSKMTTVETRIDTNEEALRDAFNAAESGIDYYLRTGSQTYTVPTSTAKAEISVRSLGNEVVLDFGEYTPEGESEFYWLVNHTATGLGSNYFGGNQITVRHKGIDGSVVINVFFRRGSGFGVKRYGYNFSNNADKRVNNFIDAIGNQSVTISPIPTNPVLMTVTPIFSGANLSIASVGVTFPAQGEEISSVGKVGEIGAGQVSKKVVIQQRYRLPNFFLDALSSEASVLSN